MLRQTGLERLQRHVAGFQETRVSWQGISSRGRYWVISFPATLSGVGGCQLWLDSKAARPALVRQGSSILDGSVLLAHAGPVKLAFFSGHAPTAKASEEVRQAWWVQLCRDFGLWFSRQLDASGTKLVSRTSPQGKEHLLD